MTTDEIPPFLMQRTLKSVRGELRSILDSYHHYWDLLAELLQNSRDSIDRRRAAERAEGKDPTPGRIHIEFNGTARSVSVTDNGTGIQKAFLSEVLAPGGGDKDRHDDEVGEKGVGLTYAAFSGNSLTIDTETASGDGAKAEMKGAAAWLHEQPRAEPPELELSDSPDRPTAEGLDSGPYARIAIGLVPTVNDDIDLFSLNIRDLIWLLRTRTAVGDTRQLLRGDDLPDTTVTLDFVGADRFADSQVVQHGYPDLTDGYDSIEIGDVERQLVRRSTTKSRRKLLKQKVVSGQAEKTVGSERIRVLGWMFPGNDAFERLAKALKLSDLEHPEAGGLIESGIYVSTKAMPTGVSIPNNGKGTYPAYYKRCFFVVESDSISFDLGRKSMHWRPQRRLQEAVEDLFRRFENVAKYQGDPPNPRPQTGETPAQRKQRIQNEWKEMHSRADLQWPDVAFDKTPTRQEAAVAAIFHELLGARLLKSYRPLATGYSSQYDLHVVHEADDGSDPLDLVIEFKVDLGSVLDDYRDGVKFQGEIDILVCWDFDEEKLAERGLTIDSVTESEAPYPGVTHLMDIPEQFHVDSLPVIALRWLRDRMSGKGS